MISNKSLISLLFSICFFFQFLTVSSQTNSDKQSIAKVHIEESDARSGVGNQDTPRPKHKSTPNHTKGTRELQTSAPISSALPKAAKADLPNLSMCDYYIISYDPITAILHMGSCMQNTGGEISSPSIQFKQCLSLDQVLSGSDIQSFYGSYPALAPGASVTSSYSSDLDSYLSTAGDYYLIFSLDPEKALEESNESDNIVSTGTTISYTPFPGQSFLVDYPSRYYEGDIATLTATSTDATAYTWAFPSDWTINSGQGTSSVTVTVGAESGSLYITGSNFRGSGSTSSYSARVSIPVGPASLDGPDTVSAGSVQEYTSYAVNATRYHWVVPDGWTINTGIYNYKISVTIGDEPGYITVTPDNEYGPGEMAYMYVTVNPAPGTPSISGTDTVCEGSIETYLAYAENADTFTWVVPEDWLINSGQGTDTLVVTVGINSGDICVTAANDFAESSQECLSIIVNQVTQDIILDGDTLLCQGVTSEYFASASKASTYTWEVPEGWSINSGQGTPNISTLTGSNSGYIIAHASNECGEDISDSLYVVITPPVGSISIEGTTNVCPGMGVIYNASSENASNFNWSAPDGWTISTGQGTGNIALIPGETPGNLCVTPSNGCSTGSEVCISIALSHIPGMAEIIGEDNLCEGENITFYATSTDAMWYAWAVPVGWTINSGISSDSLNVTTGKNSGSVCVTPHSSCGSGTGSCYDVSITELPRVGSITGEISLSAGETTNYSVFAPGADSYIWSVPSDWSLNSGQGSSSISVTAGTNSGNVCIIPGNDCGNGSEACVMVSVQDNLGNNLFEQGSDLIQVYPNPSSGILMLELAQTPTQNSFISIYNTCGSRIYHQKISEKYARIDLSVLKPGIYQLVLSNPKVYAAQIIILE